VVVAPVFFLLPYLGLFVEEALFGDCLGCQRPHPRVFADLVQEKVTGFQRI
jgi:hypothetical protein